MKLLSGAHPSVTLHRSDAVLLDVSPEPVTHPGSWGIGTVSVRHRMQIASKVGGGVSAVTPGAVRPCS